MATAALAVSLTGCSALPVLTLPTFPVPAAIPAPPVPGGAAAALATLPVKGRAPKTGYTRDLTRETFKPGTHDCVVLTGTLKDPYTGRSIAFTRGQGSSEAVQIDHVVALSDAWQKGAQQLTADARRRLGNDPLNLLAVDGPTNMSKGDGDAATWLPGVKPYRCSYVARQVAVKAKYGLWVTPAEHDAIAGVLAGCPAQLLPADSTVAARG